MRARLSVALLGLSMMLGALGGCGGGNEFPMAFTVSGTVVQDGTPLPLTVVGLTKNGKQVKLLNPTANRNFSFSNIPTLQTGTYTLFTGSSDNVLSFVGPFNVTTNRQFILNEPSLTDLANLVPSVKLPTNNTATLVVFANDMNNRQLQQFTVTVGTLPAVSNTPGPVPVAVLTGIVGSPPTVVVTDATNNLTATLTNVNFIGNTVEYIQAIVPGG